MTGLVHTASLERRIAHQLAWSLVALSLAAVVLLTWMTLSEFEKIILPQILSKSGALSTDIQTTIADAEQLGIPYDNLVGVDSFLNDIIHDNPEVVTVSIKKRNQLEYSASNVSEKKRMKDSELVHYDLAQSDEAPAVRISISANYIQEKLSVMIGDAAVVSLVALVISLEFALFFLCIWVLRPFDILRGLVFGLESGRFKHSLDAHVRGPLASLIHLTSQRISQLSANKASNWLEEQMSLSKAHVRDVRTPLFLFVFSEELLRSFLPVFVKDLVVASSPMATQLAIAAPLFAYMVMAGVLTLVGGKLIDKFSIRQVFSWGVIVSCLGLTALAVVHTVSGVVVARSLCAIGYAIATIACQSYISKNTAPTQSRARGLSVFVGTVTAACICGAPIGALIAELLGVRVAFVFAALLTLLSLVLFSRLTQSDKKTDHSTAQTNTDNDKTSFGALMRNSNILFAVCCGVMPGKLMLAGFLFYITPLLLQKFGLSQALIGQFFIMYYFTLFLGNFLISRLDLPQQTAARVVLFGGIMTGLGVVPLIWFASPAGLAMAIICFGFGQSIMLTPMLSIVGHVARQEISALAVTKALALARMFERVGGVVGVLLAAVLSATIGYRDACIVLGFLSSILGCGLVVFVQVSQLSRVKT
jgi:predicted MFS family arabinose efflux permease